jgi:hypothetical protein
MTQDVYMGRRAVDPAAARALEGMVPDDGDHDGDEEEGDDPPMAVGVGR